MAVLRRGAAPSGRKIVLPVIPSAFAKRDRLLEPSVRSGRLSPRCGQQKAPIRTMEASHQFRFNPCYLLTLSASAFPALNLTTFFAAILIFFPVCGFRPSRAFLFTTEKVPNPTNPSFPLFLSSLDSAPSKASSAYAAAAFVTAAPSAMTAINSAFVIPHIPLSSIGLIKFPPPQGGSTRSGKALTMAAVQRCHRSGSSSGTMDNAN